MIFKSFFILLFSSILFAQTIFAWKHIQVVVVVQKQFTLLIQNISLQIVFITFDRIMLSVQKLILHNLTSFVHFVVISRINFKEKISNCRAEPMFTTKPMKSAAFSTGWSLIKATSSQSKFSLIPMEFWTRLKQKKDLKSTQGEGGSGAPHPWSFNCCVSFFK
jgi:hypothetical protein